MRVLVLENEPSSARGGQERSLFDVCRGLAARGHSVELLYTGDGDLLDQYRTFCARVDRVRSYAIDRSRTVRGGLGLLSDVVQPTRTPPDVIYANQYMDSPFARLLAARFRRPFVCHLRLPPPDHFCGQYRWGMRGTIRLIANSEATRANYVTSGFRRDRIDVVYNGIDLDVYQPRLTRAEVRKRIGVEPESFVLLYAGRLHPGKAIDVLIEAFAAIPAPTDLVIAGNECPDGSGRDYEHELRQQIAALGIDARCHLVGHVDALADLYSAADVTVLPSIVAEGFGRVIVESMACGTPVVASRVGGIPEILSGEFESWLVPAGDVRALTARLETVRNERVKRPDLTERCRAHVVRNFDLSRMVAGVEEVLLRTATEWEAGTSLAAADAALQ